MALKDITIKKKDLILVDPAELLEIEAYNARNMESPETLAHIEQMALSMVENGIANFPPVTISAAKDGKVYLYAGYCRRRAALRARELGAPLTGIWAISNNQTEQERVLDLLTSNNGLPLTQLEKASVIQRLVKFEWSVAEIAKKMGVTHRAISDLLILLEAPQEIKTLVEENKISATLAVETIKEDPDAVQTLNTAVENATKQGKKKATKKHVESKVREIQLEVKHCPFCGDLLVRDNEAELWRHEEALCYLSGATVSETEKDDWNQRVR